MQAHSCFTSQSQLLYLVCGDVACTFSLGPLGIAAVTLTVSFGCLLLKLNKFINVSQKERSGKEWLSPAPSLVLTVMLTLHFICSPSHYIGTVLN